MSLANQVTVGTAGRIVIARQLHLEAPPYTNCRILELVELLEFGGLHIADRQRFIADFRKATGIPEIDPKTGKPRGTNGSDILRVMAAALPWVPITCDLVGENELLAGLSSGEITCSVSVTYGLLPTRQRRWSPTFTGGHEIRLAGARYRNGHWEVLWSDCLGRGRYRGEWVAWNAVRPAMWGSKTAVLATVIARGAALSTLISPVKAYAQPATATIKRSTQLYALDANALTVAPAGRVIADTTGHVDALLNVTQRPQRPPTGQFARIVDGPASGKLVRVADVTIAEVPSLDCAAQVSAAVAPLNDEIEQWIAYADTIGTDVAARPDVGGIAP